MRAYFDYNATAPMDPQVLEAMEPFMASDFGNASSRHEEGRRAHDAVERARAQVAAAVNARPEEVFFTASGTEANNTIVKGVAALSSRKTIAVSGIEHPCVLCAARAMVRRGWRLAPIAVDSQGLVDREDLEKILASGDVALVSVMLANNESGVIQDIEEIARLARAAGAVVHSDAVQALGKIEIDFEKLGVDALSLSGHKARGPMGVAAMVVRTEVEFEPLMEGGGHERGARSGTLNVPGIVGFGKAAELAAQRMGGERERLAGLQQSLESRLLDAGAVVYGAGAPRLPNTTYFGFPGIEGETMVVMLDQAGFAVASGSACSSTKNEPSHVLMAMGLEEAEARTAVRVSLGAGSDQDQVDKLAATVVQLAERLKAMAAVAV